MSGSDSEETSGSDSDSGSGRGLQHANASAAAGASRATHPQLRAHPVQRRANSTQSQSNDATDLQRRLAAIHIEYYRQPGQSAPSAVGSTSSGTSSMALSARSTIASSGPSSMYSGSTAPSLSTSPSTTRSGASLKTGSIGLGVGRYYELEQGEDEIGELPEEGEADVRLECCFGFLRCPHVFDNLETWDRHSRAHYRGALPSVARCPFPGCHWVRTGQPGQDVWACRLSHMEDDHDDQNYAYPRDRLPAAAVEGFYRAGMIDVAQYQELRRDGRLSDRPVLNIASRRQEQDGRRRRR